MAFDIDAAVGRKWLLESQFIRGGSTNVSLEVQYFDLAMNYLAREALTVSTTAVTLASVPAAARFAIIHIGPADTPTAWVRWLASAAPTATQGTPIFNDAYLEVTPLTRKD